jgi:anion-transporting  ArsA/GET3 family ATPase
MTTHASSRVQPFESQEMFNVMRGAPVTFVTGKGGVGKTTVASLLSKESATHGERVLFVSLYNDKTTQSALGIDDDLLPGEVIPTKIDNVDFVISTPVDALVKYLANKKLSAISSKLTNTGLLNAVANVVPGMRELLTIGDIRAKYESKQWDRIIVDTPSTGHAQSIFDIANMADATAKSGIVKQQAVSARNFLQNKDVTQVVVVTLDHVMPLSECKEFVFALEESLNAHIACIVVNRSNVIANKHSHAIDRELGDIFLPIYAIAPFHARASSHTSLWKRFRKQQLPPSLSRNIRIDGATTTAILLGTGGVGKTTTSAALAVAHARHGKRVALLTIDPARRLGTALGLENSASRESHLDPHNLKVGKTPAKSLLHVFQLDSRNEFFELLENTLSKKDFKKIKRNAFVQGVSRAGILNEFMAIEAMYRLSSSGEYDLVVIDTPPSHHVFDLLEAPSALQRVFRSSIFKTIVSASSMANWGANIALKTFFKPIQLIVGKVLVEDTVEFLRTLRDVEDVFSQHNSVVAELLKSNSTQYIGVSRPDEASRGQILDVGEELRSKGYRFNTLVLNGCDLEEFDIVGDVGPFGEHARSENISVSVIEHFEFDEPEKIVLAMAEEISP